MGLVSTPAKLPISPASGAIGPPAAPEAIAPIASTCSVLAPSSMIRPTVQSPSAIGPGV